MSEMRYAGIIPNDISAAPGVCVTFFSQGCPHRCPGCHNPETWDFRGGYKYRVQTTAEILKALKANGIKRNLCIMGGEPLCPENIPVVRHVITSVKAELPETKVFLWTGYTYEELQQMNSDAVRGILNKCEAIVDGRFILEQRDVTLPMRGSRNQRVIFRDENALRNCKGTDVLETADFYFGA